MLKVECLHSDAGPVPPPRGLQAAQWIYCACQIQPPGLPLTPDPPAFTSHEELHDLLASEVHGFEPRALCMPQAKQALLSCAKRFASVVRSSPRQPVLQIKPIFPDYNSGSKQRSSTHQTVYKAESAGVPGISCYELFLLGPLASKHNLHHKFPHSTKSAAAPRRHAPTQIGRAHV